MRSARSGRWSCDWDWDWCWAGPRGAKRRRSERWRRVVDCSWLWVDTPTTAICARLICPIAALQTVGVGEVVGSTRCNQQNNRRRISRPRCRIGARSGGWRAQRRPFCDTGRWPRASFALLQKVGTVKRGRGARRQVLETETDGCGREVVRALRPLGGRKASRARRDEGAGCLALVGPHWRGMFRFGN